MHTVESQNLKSRLPHSLAYISKLSRTFCRKIIPSAKMERVLTMCSVHTTVDFCLSLNDTAANIALSGLNSNQQGCQKQ